MNEKQIEAIVSAVLAQVATKQKDLKEVPVEVSARHVHLSKEDMEFLFGGEDQLKKVKDLSQPGQYVYDQRVTIMGPKGCIQNVAILGPSRPNTQVEISLTDARVLGVKAPIRESGDLKNSAGIIIAAGGKAINLEEGVIVAKRHIHMTPQDAKTYDVKDGDLVKVRIQSERPVVLEDVLIRVSEKYSLSMHIDHDEGNAAAYQPGTTGIIMK